ncbi:TPA: hypothetical protein KD870_004059 [Vibrio parahaemolyticus]|nr:hypothetical protein [Vibrio parahaemolyticus]
MAVRKAIFVATAMTISACAGAQAIDSTTPNEPLSFNIESEEVVNGTQYTTITINWNENQTQRKLQDAKVMAYDSETNKSLSEVRGWTLMENKPKAIHDANKVGIVKSDREKTVYLLSEVAEDLPVCFSVQGDKFSYDSCANNHPLLVQSIAETKELKANTTPYVIKSATFAWDYNTIFANNKHQLKFYLDVVATSCFDESSGAPLSGGQCENAPELGLWDIPLSDSPSLQTFHFRRILNNQPTDLTHFNKTYEAEGIYLKHAPPQTNKMGELPTQKTTKELPPYEQSKRYTFYLTASSLTDNDINLCVELDKKDAGIQGTEDYPSFSYSNCSSPNSANNISAISPLNMPLVINGQSPNTYSVSYQRTKTDQIECDYKKLGVSGHVIGINIKEVGYIENVPTAFYFNKDVTKYTLPYYEHNVHCKNYGDVHMNRKFVMDTNLHLSRVKTDYSGDSYHRNNGLASISQVTQFDAYLHDNAVIFGAFENELDGTAAGGAMSLSRDTLAEYTSLDGSSTWQTHLLTVRWVHDNNDVPTDFYNPDAVSTARPSGNSHSYYITDSFGNQSAINLTYDDSVKNLVDSYGGTIPLF